MAAIRRSEKNDAGVLHQIWVEAVRATRHFVTPEDLDEFSAIVRDQYLPAVELTVALDDDGKPVAFLGATGQTIDALFVHPAHHGRGIGRALIEHLFPPEAVIRLDVNEANAPARAFYSKLGFTECGRSELDSSGKPYPIIHMVRQPHPYPFRSVVHQ